MGTNDSNCIPTAYQLHTQAHNVYDQQQLQRTEGGQPRTIHMKRPLVYYLGFNQLMKGLAYQKLGKYEISRDCVEQYAELGWVKDVGDLESQEIVEHFRMLAKANTYTLDLLQGKESVLPEYIQFLHENSAEEVIPGMITVLESATMHNYDINLILKEFAERVGELGSFYRELKV